LFKFVVAANRARSRCAQNFFALLPPLFRLERRVLFSLESKSKQHRAHRALMRMKGCRMRSTHDGFEQLAKSLKSVLQRLVSNRRL